MHFRTIGLLTVDFREHGRDRMVLNFTTSEVARFVEALRPPLHLAEVELVVRAQVHVWII